MGAVDWRASKDLFLQASALEPYERERLLAERARTEPELVDYVQRALAVAHDSPDFLEPPKAEHLDEPLRLLKYDFHGTTFDDYELHSEIGRGSSGVVYLGRQLSVDRRVAIKVLAPHLAGTPAALAQFEREARRAARLRHPGVAAVVGFGSRRGFAYLAMEYVEGRTLHQHIDDLRRARETGPTPPPGTIDVTDPSVAARIALQLCEALEHCHGEGIVHRDIKPMNVLLDAKGAPHLVDFGVAKDQKRVGAGTEGHLSGTPHYMSPEQAEARTGELDSRTDIYSLGVVLYEMLTLRRPFEGDATPALLGRILRESATPVHHVRADVPRSLSAICNRALRKDPRSRHESAAALAHDLREFLRGGRVSVGARMWFEDAYRAVFVRYPWVPVSAALLLFALIAVFPTRGSEGAPATTTATPNPATPPPNPAAPEWTPTFEGYDIDHLPADEAERRRVMAELIRQAIEAIPEPDMPPQTGGNGS